jgi:hypothetical protein
MDLLFCSPMICIEQRFVLKCAIMISLFKPNKDVYVLFVYWVIRMETLFLSDQNL